MANDPSRTPDCPLYLYLVVLGNLVAVAGMTFLLIGILGGLGLVTPITDRFDVFGNSFLGASTGSAVKYSYAFVAALLAFAASWKMMRERPRIWLLLVVIVFQGATAAVFHSWVSVISLVPTVAALYGLVRELLPGGARYDEAARPAANAAFAAVPGPRPGPTPPAAAAEPAGSAGAAESAGSAGAVPPVSGHAVSPASLATRRCPDCGAANSEGARFCNKCGCILPG